jgi:hypothetical protein
MSEDHLRESLVKFGGEMKHYMHLKSSHPDSFFGKIREDNEQ